MVAHRKEHLPLVVEARLIERAAAMRANPTTSESALWPQVCCDKLGVAFRRQFIIGRYIADLAAPAVRLVVEIDGGYHGRRVVADARRDRDLRRLEYTVLHMEAGVVLGQVSVAVDAVRAAVQAVRAW